jgi:hypothetical protein
MMAGTRWIKLDTAIYRNPKVAACPPASVAVYIAGLCYCGDHLTDGVISRAGLRTVLAEARATRRAIDPLVAAGLWLPVHEEYVVHDYTAMQWPRERVLASREAALKRQRRYRT